MQQPNQREMDVSTLTVAARTVVLEGASIEGPHEVSFFEALIGALGHWKGAGAAAVAVLALAWVATDGMRSSAKAEFLLQAPVDEFSQMKSAADAARAIELVPVPAADGDFLAKVTAKPEKTSDLILVSVAVPRTMPTGDVKAEADRVIKALNADLGPALEEVTKAIDARLQSIDESIAEARAILDHPEKLPAQSNATGLVMTEVVKLREERSRLLRRRDSAAGLRLVGEVRVTAPKILSTGTLAPPLAAAGTFAVAAFILRGFAQARAQARLAGARN